MVKLRDGSRVVIRPLEPDDRAALRQAFERLSPESRYRRFFGPMAQLRERDLDYLTNIDHHDHEAVVAVDEDGGDLVGVARFVRTAPEAAEPAITVADDWQGRGVGTRLLDALVDRARAEGVRRFDAPILATNDEAIRVFERLGDTTIDSNGREVELHIDLPAERPGPDWHRLLRQFAAGAAEPGRTLWELVWPRRRRPPTVAPRNVIVLGTDGSDHADAAADTAAELARAFGASIEVVGAHRFLPSDQEDAADAVAAAGRRLRGRDLHVHERVRRGDPALVLSDVAAETDARLIVVGAGEHSKVSRRLVGGVADLVAERAPCNVLIVRPSPRARG
jgi:nucleotide-binding universal stress UspA family protein/GNAT superfamily N-acetyltransferase